MQIQPYIHFDGKCADALEFYKKALGAKINMLMFFRDAPPSNDPKMTVPPELKNQVMHSSFTIGDSTIMASDCGKPLQGFSLSVGLDSSADVERFHKALSEGGQSLQEPQETFFAHRFAVCNDPYGVNWMLLHPKEQRIERTA